MSLFYTRYSAASASSLIFISVFVLTIWILFAVELGVAKKIEDNYKRYWSRFPDHTSDGKEPHPAYPDWRWSTGGDDNGFFMFFLRSFALLADTIHLPIAHALVNKQKMHPVAALVTSLVMFLAWVMSVCWAIFILYSNENWSRNANVTLAGAGVAIQVIVSILYLSYMVISARSVHFWRKQRRIVEETYALAERRPRKEGTRVRTEGV